MMPSGEVSMSGSLFNCPTATKREPDHAIPDRYEEIPVVGVTLVPGLGKPVSRVVQVTPSGEVMMSGVLFDDPTATN